MRYLLSSILKKEAVAPVSPMIDVGEKILGGVV